MNYYINTCVATPRDGISRRIRLAASNFWIRIQPRSSTAQTSYTRYPRCIEVILGMDGVRELMALETPCNPYPVRTRVITAT